jgi:hypothetical protein
MNAFYVVACVALAAALAYAWGGAVTEMNYRRKVGKLQQENRELRESLVASMANSRVIGRA